MKIALVRGTFLAEYECQIFYPLVKKHDFTAFSSLRPYQDKFPFKVVKLPSPMDISFGLFNRVKMPILNRMFIDAQWLIGLEEKLKGYDIAHAADTFYHYTHQCVEAKREGKVKKVVATIYENIPFNNEGIWGRTKFKQDVLIGVDHFIAVSERSKEVLILEGADETKISVVTQHIDTERFSPRKDFRKESKKITILFVGRIEFYKGVYEIIYAGRKLLSDKKLSEYRLQFVFVGNGGEKKRLIELTRKLDMQNNVGFKAVPYSQMQDIYKDADIFVAPSRATRTYQEQFCTSLLEAQASGLPIVTTASGGIPENVGDAALVANPGDFYSIGEALKKFILSSELRELYSNKARKRAVTKFDVKIGSKRLEKIYEDVLSGKR